MNHPVYLSDQEIAERLRVSISAIRRWRYTATDPKFVYRSDHPDAFLESKSSGQAA